MSRSNPSLNNEPPEEEVLVDRPGRGHRRYPRDRIVLLLRPQYPTPMEWDEETKDADGIEAENTGSFTEIA